MHRTIWSVVLVLISTSAFADTTQVVGIQRQGFLIGFSLGGGSMTDSSCDGGDCEISGGAADVHLGGMITPQLGLMVDSSGVTHSDGDYTLSHNVVTVAAQYWLTPRFWIKAGLGNGRLSVSVEGDGYKSEWNSAWGVGALAAAGYELYQGKTFALDVQLRGAATTYEDYQLNNGSLSLGFNWY